jgi:hypothetical protein
MAKDAGLAAMLENCVGARNEKAATGVAAFSFLI